MEWYYAEGQQQRGPVSESQFEDLTKAGIVKDDTLVWREGLANWQPYGQVKAPAGAPPPPPPQFAPPPEGGVVCSQCHGIFGKKEVVQYGDVWVCASCKPAFLQRSRGGLSVAVSGARGPVSEAQVRERDYEHDTGDYLSRSWQVFKSDPWPIIGVSLVVALCIILANGIPYLSVVTSIVLTGPLFGGLFAFYLKKIRGQEPSFGDGFSGFGPDFGQLLLGHFIPNLLAALALVPCAVIAVIFALLVPAINGSDGLSLALIALLIGGGVLVLVGFCVMIYLQYCWLFTLWLIVDKGMPFWPAMGLSRAVVRKHWWQTLWLGIVAGLLLFAGLLPCGLGLFVTGPVVIGMFAFAYERLFGDMQTA